MMKPSQPTKFTVILAVVFSMLGASCTLRPTQQQTPKLAFDVPQTWTNTNRSEISIQDHWWTRFNSESLNQTVEIALAQNYNIASAAARLEIAAADARIAGANLYPQVNGSLNASRQRVDFSSDRANESISASTANSFGVSLDISWELDVWGRIRASTRAAVANVQAAQADWVGAKQSIAAQTTKVWLAAAEAAQHVTLAKATVESYRNTARQVTNRVEAGIQAPNDMHLALTNLASAEAMLQQRKQTLDAVRRQLDVLLGRYPAGTISEAAVLPDVLPALPPSGLPSELIKRRPDLVAAERKLTASSESVSAATADLYPRFALTASGGSTSDEFKNVLSGGSFVWGIAGNLIQPIFDGGRLRANVSSAKGKADEAIAIFAQGVLNAFAEVETALYAEDVLAERERFLHIAAQEARKAVEVSQNRYGQGVEAFIVVLESQRRSLDAERAVLSVHRLRLENRVNLHLALGGGFEDVMPIIPSSTEPNEG